MRRFLSVVVMAGLLAPVTAGAQDGETLADIRQELSVLYVEIQRLKREMSTTGASGELVASGTLLDRVDAIETEVTRLTSKAEELEFRIDRVVSDGSNRIGDLEFRLCELEPDCDIATLEPGDTLGGEAAEGTTGGAQSVNTQPETDGPQLAIGEEADFAAAETAMAEGRYDEAAAILDKFRQDYPGGPLSGRAGLMQGEALEQSGQLTQAARAYLNLFSEDQSGPQAPDALFRLGRSLGRLGKSQEACLTLAEVEVRYPGSAAVDDALAAMQNIGCQ